MTNLNPASAPTDTVPQIIEQHIFSAIELLEILKQERNALISGKPEAIEQVCSSKIKLVNTFRQHSENLTHCIGTETIEQVIARSGLQQRWQQLLALATECQKNNLANGALLDERQSYVRHAIKCLFGHEAKPGVYGRWGDTSFRPERRMIASA